MALRFSSGTIYYILHTGSLKAAFGVCVLDMYDGAQPTNPDAASTTFTNLARITDNGGAFVFITGTNTLAWENDASGTVLRKQVSQLWRNTNATAGTCGWCRMLDGSVAEDNGQSTTSKRMDMTVGPSADLQIANVFTGGQAVDISQYQIDMALALTKV